MSSHDPERQGDGARPRWIRSPADLTDGIPSRTRAQASLEALQQVSDSAQRAADRENLIIGGLLLGQGATLLGLPVVWDLHWPEGMPPGMDDQALREIGARMMAAAGGNPAPGPERPVAGLLAQAIALIREALTIRFTGNGDPLSTDWREWERRAQTLIETQHDLGERARGLAQRGHGEE